MSAIPESIWLILLIWLGLLAMGIKEHYYAAIGALIGIVFGLLLMPLVSQWLGIVITFLNIYIFYKSIFEEAKEK